MILYEKICCTINFIALEKSNYKNHKPDITLFCLFSKHTKLIITFGILKKRMKIKF